MGLKFQRTEEEDAYEVIFEASLIKYATGLVSLALVLWVGAISTNYWIVVVGGEEGIPLNGSLSGRTFLWSHSGLWSRCDYYDPPEWNNCLSKTYGDHHFVQLEMAIIVLVFILIAISTAFSFYSIAHLRYTYKRIAGSLHLLTSALLLLLMELIKTQSHLQNHHEVSPEESPVLPQSTTFLGYSFLLAVTVFSFYLISGLAFFFSSKKKGKTLTLTGHVSSNEQINTISLIYLFNIEILYTITYSKYINWDFLKTRETITLHISANNIVILNSICIYYALNKYIF
eukprot:TRINITY_DN1066_c2_g1_i1.p1 TRINITY_DN1066_c2_g1~~TRINITY_DN1066_c2_g1_i1.p1  ORF type:complete len:286 (+),score=36.57 TRINITY_DN1066_c2_g1_i1:97-954(+)